jgi:hypothetical protein
MTENLQSKHGEAVNNDSLVAARRSREVEERDGPRRAAKDSIRRM